MILKSRRNMRRTEQWMLAALVATPAVLAADASRPRGVGPELAKHYKSPDTFSCIFNPSIEIPSSRVNDDYCDCPDGSDEPGTAACAHLSHNLPPSDAQSFYSNANTTLALPGFYCKNKGHIPSYLPLTNVNDGVCDYDLCCDGSDEYNAVGGIKCPDKCKEIGKEWRKQDEIRQKSMGSALRKRVEMITESSRIRREVEDKVKDLKVLVEGSQAKVKELEGRLEEEKRLARGRLVKGPGKAGKTVVLAGLTKTRIEELRGALAQVHEERNRALTRVEELEQILSTFKEEYNPNFNDEGVKRAVRAWEDYAARDKDAEGEIHELDLTEILKSEAESGAIHWEEWERPEEGDIDVLYEFEAYLPPSLRAWVDNKLRSLRVFLVENGVLASAVDTSESSEDPAVATARRDLDTAKSTLSQQERDLTSHQEDLTRDYGPDEVFRSLKDKCISTESGEYTYELCFMAQAKQLPRKGGGSTNMGNFVRFDIVHSDEDLPVDGKGLGRGPRTVLRYEGGQGCWNGPSRSTTVVLACHEDEELWKIVEEEKCVYRMEVGTPAVCEKSASGKAAVLKDEL